MSHDSHDTFFLKGDQVSPTVQAEAKVLRTEPWRSCKSQLFKGFFTHIFADFEIQSLKKV